MESQERWRRPGVRLAVLALIGITIYFLWIFVKQSLNLYQLTRERGLQEARVTQLAQQNLRLKARLEAYLDEEGRKLLVEKNLPYIGPGEHVAVPVAGPEANPTPKPEPAANLEEELAALPAWQQWWRVIFTPMSP
jgi:hypothetical protein